MAWQFDLCGDHLALDFANTVSNRHTDSPVERLTDYGELVSFARQTGIVSDDEAAALATAGRRRPRLVGNVHRRALELRDALYDLFAALAHGTAPAAEDVKRLDAELGRLQIDSSLMLTWRHPPGALDGFVGAIVLAAVQLATDADERGRVRMCEAPDCVWLFYDTSRNRSRRWCDMRQCGNRMKARRHYARGRGRRKRTGSSRGKPLQSV